MMSVFYFGPRPEPALAHSLAVAGHAIIHAQYAPGVLNPELCSAVILHWKNERDQRVIREARAIGVPVLVITSRLAAAFRSGEPFAELYLESPADPSEITTIITDMIAAKQRTNMTQIRSARAVA